MIQVVTIQIYCYLVIRERFILAGEAAEIAEEVIEKLSDNGGHYLYDKYLQTKDDPHCSSRLIQFFEEGVQFSFFPGDPGEPEETFDENWLGDSEPIEAEIDHWATKIVKTKQVVKMENQTEEISSSARSKRAPSIASSRKTFKMRKMQGSINGNKLDVDQRSRHGDSTRERSERKENLNNLNMTSATISNQQNLNLIPLEVEPPREIPIDEKILRDRKDKQLKMKELEMKEQQEKEERERQRMKNKLDAFAEIEKSDYTYDHTGKILMVKKPNIQRLPGTQQVTPEYQLHNQTMNKTSQHQSLVKPTGKAARLMSAKPGGQKELKIIKESRKEESILQEKAEQELQENYQKLFNQQEESLKEYGIQKEGLEVNAGIILTDKEGRRMRGPNIDRTNKMTLQEYQKIAAQFEVMNDERLSRYGSAKKLHSQGPDNASQLDYIKEDEESIEYNRGKGGKKSPERILKKLGADEIYEKEITYTQYKINLKAKRKDLKSANIKNMNEKVIAKHNKEVRITSAKQQQDVRIRKTPVGAKERIFNYENQLGQGIDFNYNSEQSRMSVDIAANSVANMRPQSGHPNNLLNKKNLHLGDKKDQPASLIDEFNKKLVEKGTAYPILPQELPQASQYLQRKQDRPQTSKPIIRNNAASKLKIISSQDQPMNFETDMGRNSVLTAAVSSSAAGFLNTKTQPQKKAARERIISAKIPKDHDKLPPPPFGKTMGHGLLKNQLK